jgi:hypothetical protein
MQNKKTKQKKSKTKIKTKTKSKQKSKSHNFKKAGVDYKHIDKKTQLLLKTQGTLSHKLDGKTIELKINDDIIKKINDIIEQQIQEQITNRKKISESMKACKKAMKELLKLFDEEQFQDLLQEIEALENMPLENFDKKNLKEREKDAKIIKDDVKSQLEIGIENESMRGNDDIVADFENLLTDVENSP